jgi:hypothetical protein
MKTIISVVAAIAALVLAGCSNSKGSAPLPAPGTGTGPSPAQETGTR